MRIPLGGPLRLALISSAVLASAAGVSYATSSVLATGTSVIHGCYLNRIGTLRVIDPNRQRCSFVETPIQWNQAGPPGLNGAPGPSGPKGDPGRKGDPGTLASIDQLEGTPCTLGGRTGATHMAKGDGKTSFYMNFECILPDGLEPNSTADTAGKLPVNSFGTIDPAGEDDWYSLPSTSIGWISMSGDRGDPLTIELYQDGKPIATGAPDPTTGNITLFFAPPDTTPHDWLVHVTAPQPLVYWMSWG